MDTRRIFLTTCIFAVAVLLLFSASIPLGASNAQPASITTAAGSPPLAAPTPRAEGIDAIRATADGEVEILGTMWQPQNRKQFKEWSVLGWGTQAKLKAAKAPSDEWVHISPTKLNTLNGVAQKISYVNVCGSTSNPTASRPIAIHLWSEGNDRFYAADVRWADLTSRQCISIPFSPAVTKYGIGISLQIHFANGTDTVTLQEVWVGLSE